MILNLKDPQLIGMMSGDIGRVADGTPSHFASALKLGLKKAIELKRRSKGILLHCSECGSQLYFKSDWYRTNYESGPPCPSCLGSWSEAYNVMECDFCRQGVIGGYISCQNCKRWTP